MTTRRDFLRGAITLAGGLIVGEEVLEAFARLTHVRKSFPSSAMMKPFAGFVLTPTGWHRVEEDDDPAILAKRFAGLTEQLMPQVRS